MNQYEDHRDYDKYHTESLRDCFFFKYLLLCWGKKKVLWSLSPPPRWPACPCLCREGVHGAKTGSPPWTDFFLSLWAGPQGYTSSRVQLGAAVHWGWGWHFVSQVGSSSQPLSVEQISSALPGTRLVLCRSDWALEKSLLCFCPHDHSGKFWLCTRQAAFTALQPVLRKEGYLAFALFITGKKMISICEVSSHVLWRGKGAASLGTCYRRSLNCNRLGSWPCFFSSVCLRKPNMKYIYIYIVGVCNFSALHQQHFEVAPPLSPTTWGAHDFVHMLMLLSSAIISARGCAGWTPWCSWWLAQTCFCQGSVPLLILLLLPAGLLLPAPACWSLGNGGLENVSLQGQCCLFLPRQSTGDKLSGIPTVPPARRASRCIREAAGGGRACQCRRARGIRGSGSVGLMRGRSCRGWPRPLFVLWLTWLQPAKFGTLPEVVTWKTSVVINFLCHACFEGF